MTHDEAEAFALARVPGQQVLRVEPRPFHDGDWQVYAWCADPPHGYAVVDGALFRETVRKGLVEGFARNALDHKY